MNPSYVVHGMTKCENMVEGKFDPKYLLGIIYIYSTIIVAYYIQPRKIIKTL